MRTPYYKLHHKCLPNILNYTVTISVCYAFTSKPLHHFNEIRHGDTFIFQEAHRLLYTAKTGIHSFVRYGQKPVSLSFDNAI